MSNEIMTVQELASYLQIGAGKLYRLAQEGQIPATKVGRTWRFRRDLVDAWFVRVSKSTEVLNGQEEAGSRNGTGNAE